MNPVILLLACAGLGAAGTIKAILIDQVAMVPVLAVFSGMLLAVAVMLWMGVSP